MDSRLCWIWLQQALGYGSPWAGPLLTAFVSPEGIYAADKEALRPLKLPAGVLKRLCDKSMERARGILWRTLSDGDWILTPADEAYPPLLRGIHSPPLVLYGRGLLPDFGRQPVIGLVGTRKISTYGRRVADMLVGDMARAGALIVSGIAEGGDEAILNAALDAGGLVVAVLPCGLDVNYPAITAPLRRRILQNEGALITEYPYGERVAKGTFHVRNRLISGLANGLCVIEAPARSGALITARYAREQGRDVFAVPGALTSPNSVGVHELIKGGAKLVSCAEEILEEYRPLFSHILEEEWEPTEPTLQVAQTPAALPEQASPGAQAIYRLLEGTPR
ncbi:MAG: DNA-processing protein DprA, partial [Clostridia bacterium]|nr:DNA-processing protein DprA [Clostridia bacterium]